MRTFYGEDKSAIGEIDLDYFKPHSKYNPTQTLTLPLALTLTPTLTLTLTLTLAP